MSLELWLPPSTVEYRCSCGAEFSDMNKGIKHAVECVRGHHDEIEAEVAVRDVPGISGPLDTEAYKWGRGRMAQGKVGFRRGRAA